MNWHYIKSESNDYSTDVWSRFATMDLMERSEFEDMIVMSRNFMSVEYVGGRRSAVFYNRDESISKVIIDTYIDHAARGNRIPRMKDMLIGIEHHNSEIIYNIAVIEYLRNTPKDYSRQSDIRDGIEWERQNLISEYDYEDEFNLSNLVHLVLSVCAINNLPLMISDEGDDTLDRSILKSIGVIVDDGFLNPSVEFGSKYRIMFPVLSDRGIAKIRSNHYYINNKTYMISQKEDFGINIIWESEGDGMNDVVFG